MKSDRLDYYRNQLRGVAVADLGRAAWAVLLEATQWPYLTQGIRNNQWLFRVAEKIATMPLYDLEKKSIEIDSYLKSQGRSDLCRIKKNEGEWSDRCEIEPRINWMARMRNAAYKAAFEYVECNWSRAA